MPDHTVPLKVTHTDSWCVVFTNFLWTNSHVSPEVAVSCESIFFSIVLLPVESSCLYPSVSLNFFEIAFFPPVEHFPFKTNFCLHLFSCLSIKRLAFF